MVRHTRSEQPAQQLVSLSEAAEHFGVSVKTLRRRIADGTIRGYRIGSLIRIDLHELQDRLLIEIPSMK